MEIKDYLTGHPKKYLIFDLDGTIALLDVDWSTYRRELWDVVRTFDPQLADETPLERGRSLAMTNKAIEKHGKKAKDILNRFNEIYELKHYRGYLRNPELLDFIKNNSSYVFFLWTNNHRKTFLPFLKENNLENTFRFMVSRDSVFFLKPYPEGFSYIHIPGTNRKDYLMIGDSEFDKKAAEGAGIDFYLVDYFSRE